VSWLQQEQEDRLIFTSFFIPLTNVARLSIFVVQHGPDWIIKLLARQIKQGAGFACALAYQDLQPTQGNIYLARADHHLIFFLLPVSLEFNQESKENDLCPSVDCFFRNAATVFGEFCVAVILSGVGRAGHKEQEISKLRAEQFLLKTSRLRQYLLCQKPLWTRR
jgi:chemotaxis response regulator CheB